MHCLSSWAPSLSLTSHEIGCVQLSSAGLLLGSVCSTAVEHMPHDPKGVGSNPGGVQGYFLLMK